MCGNPARNPTRKASWDTKRVATKEDRIGLLGGTFNPIHYGHLLIAQEALAHFGLQRVLFIPNRQPPHRRQEADLASEEHRWAMATLAVTSHPRFYVSRLELEREGPSYTVDTVARVKAATPEAGLHFITGSDALMKYAWKDLDGLLSHLAAFVVATRPGFPLELLQQRLDSMDLANVRRIVALQVPGIEISSTMIRKRLSAGGSIRYLVPRAVEDYIVKHGLYGARQSGGELG